MLLAPVLVARLFGAPEPVPVVNAQLNGVFALALARSATSGRRATSSARRGYLWVAGVFAKGAGASVFVLDHFANGSPAAFLLFAATDGTLALVTLALLRRRPGAVGRPVAGLVLDDLQPAAHLVGRDGSRGRASMSRTRARTTSVAHGPGEQPERSRSRPPR